MRILLTGATGYIGGRLAPLLLDAGHEVRCITRHPERLRDVGWADRAEVVRGDVLQRADLDRALDGVDLVYYLVHSIGTGAGFEEQDRRAARTTAEAAARAGTGRIIYLGGLAPAGGERPSPHLASRAEVGRILLDGGTPAIVVQAGVIIGSGSASFEMLRYLTERLPVMVTPRWVRSRVQPVAVRDVLAALLAVAALPADTNRTFDLGGPDVLTYAEMMQRYARVAGLRRRVIVPVPVLSPWLSSQWVNVVTPVPKALAQPLIESLRNSVVAREHDLLDLVPTPPVGFDDSVRLALARIRDLDVATRWSGASWPGAPSDPMPLDPGWSGGTSYRDVRSVTADAPVEEVWRVVEGIGGDRGWYSWRLAWAVRGLMDRLAGGVGLRRGRRHPDRLQVGEALDFWRVEALERPRLLRLRAEMRLPGEAWLEFEVEPGPGPGRSVLHQRALFLPRGLAGDLYWRSLQPFHGVIFGRMAHHLAEAAEAGRRRPAGTVGATVPAE